MTIPPEAVEAAEQATFRELKPLVGNLEWAEDSTTYGAHAARIATKALQAALPLIRAELAKQVRAEMPPLSARRSGQTMRACMEYVAQLIEGTTP